MVIVLSVIGLLAAAWVWENVNPIAGVIVGFLFVGGLGWSLVGSGLNLLKPSARKAYGPEGREFIAAWEQRFGILTPGSRNHPAPGSFQAWLRDNRRTGIAPGAWIDMKTNPNPFDAGFESYSREMANRIPAPGTVEGRCKVLADRDIPGLPRDVYLLADRERLLLRVLRNAGEVAVLPWDDIFSWTRMGEDVRGEAAWELTLDKDATCPTVSMGSAFATSPMSMSSGASAGYVYQLRSIPKITASASRYTSSTRSSKTSTAEETVDRMANLVPNPTKRTAANSPWQSKYSAIRQSSFLLG